MLVSRCSSQLSSHQNYERNQKSHKLRAKPRDLQCAFLPNKGPASELSALSARLFLPCLGYTSMQWRTRDWLGSRSSRRTRAASSLAGTFVWEKAHCRSLGFARDDKFKSCVPMKRLLLIKAQIAICLVMTWPPAFVRSDCSRIFSTNYLAQPSSLPLFWTAMTESSPAREC